MSQQTPTVRHARLALEQVAAELDRTALGGGYLTADVLSLLARKVRDAAAVYDSAVASESG
ncbi:MULTISPECIES: hypothetical protein [Nocardia]|uniref:hypothetical protein n=1 Tax=Nocardia sp. NPDC047648 TaxID=3155625 RepID=UPI0033D43D5E